MSAEHLPPDRALWTGRIDADEAGDTRRWHQQVAVWSGAGEPGLALIGFACDAGVRRNQGRTGAAAAPAAIRRALSGLAWHRRGPVWDAGDVAVADSAAAPGDLEAGQRLLGAQVAALLGAGQRVVVLGGGHEVAWGSHQGLAARLADGETVGVVNLDAHFDLRGGAQGSSGTPFRQIAEHCADAGRAFRYLCLGVNEDANTAALFDTARALGAEWRTDTAMGVWDLQATRAQLHAFVAGVDRVHLSIDLDVLPAATAPGVSAPAARGVALELVEALIDDVRASGKLVLTDIAELNPALDIDARTARVAARLVARIAR